MRRTVPPATRHPVLRNGLGKIPPLPQGQGVGLVYCIHMMACVGLGRQEGPQFWH